MFQSVLRIHDILVWIRIRGSMPLTDGSGCGSGSFYFHHWPSRCQQKNYFFKEVSLHFSNIKSQKKSQNSSNQGVSYYFCLMIEGSGTNTLTNGSGSRSRRPKNMWIRWIRNRIRIRNTGSNTVQLLKFVIIPVPYFTKALPQIKQWLK
jgi:hypothetical protein